MVQLISTGEKAKLTPRKALRRLKHGYLTYIILSGIPTSIVLLANQYYLIGLVISLLAYIAYGIKEIPRYERFTMVKHSDYTGVIEEEDLEGESILIPIGYWLKALATVVGVIVMGLVMIEDTLLTPVDRIILGVISLALINLRLLITKRDKITEELIESTKYLLFWLCLTTSTVLFFDIWERGLSVISTIIILIILTHVFKSRLLGTKTMYREPVTKRGTQLDILLYSTLILLPTLIVQYMVGNYVVLGVFSSVIFMVVTGISLYHPNEKVKHLNNIL